MPRFAVAFSLSSAGQYLVFDSSDLSIETMELFCICVLHCFWSDVVVRICPKRLCIYGFVNKFWTGRIFERLRKVCGGSNLSTVLLLWGIYIKKCISPVRICLQTRNARNASTKFRKTSESKKAEKSLEISVFLLFSCLHLNQTLVMWCVADLDAKPCVANLDARWFCRGYTNPLAMMGVKSFRVLPGF